MFTNNPWLLYGATGRTGTLIAQEAVARGHRPVLAGRDPDRLRGLAERLDLPWVAGPATARLIGDANLVLLTAVVALAAGKLPQRAAPSGIGTKEPATVS